MKHVIIGTAGHVDHGKTCLIKALTGIDTDRLKEEKKRGITIELGFAYLDFSDGTRAGIIDVPGHEKFVKNMLAGAGGMDLAMLVVAADEGVMPQTVEHLDILSILGISKGVVVITKTDLADPELVELVTEDVQELTRGTFLEHAPVIPVSVYEQKGLTQLKQVLMNLCQSMPERGDNGKFRLPIDRIFSMKGFGTVVTGTLSEGCVKKEQEAVLYPQEIPVKIRNLQVHSRDADKAWPGQRAAVNIPGRKKEEISRGDVLAGKGTLFPTRMLDVKLELLKHTSHTVKNGSRVHIYHGTKELLGKVILMDAQEQKAGEWGYAQLRLEEVTAARRGDHFVIRFYSPVETVGGGIILDACPQKHKRRDPKALEAFAIKEAGSQKELLELAMKEHWGRHLTLEEIGARWALDPALLKNNGRRLCEEKRVVFVGEGKYLHREEFTFYQEKITEILDEFHRQFPLKEGMALPELRSRLQPYMEPETADALIGLLKEAKILKERDRLVSKYRFKVVVREEEGAVLREIQEDYKRAGFAPLATEVYAGSHSNEKKFKAIFTSLLNKKVLIRLDDQYCIHASYYERAREAFQEMAKSQPVVVLGEYRDYLSCSRKVAVALLEHFDKNGFTKKVEGGRVLKNPRPQE